MHGYAVIKQKHTPVMIKKNPLSVLKIIFRSINRPHVLGIQMTPTQVDQINFDYFPLVDKISFSTDHAGLYAYGSIKKRGFFYIIMSAMWIIYYTDQSPPCVKILL